MSETPTPTQSPLVREILEGLRPYLEEIVTRLDALEANDETAQASLDDIKDSCEALETQLEEMAFKVDYPGLED